MATITGVNIYIDGVKHNATPQPLTQATYNISNVKAPLLFYIEMEKH